MFLQTAGSGTGRRLAILAVLVLLATCGSEPDATGPQEAESTLPPPISTTAVPSTAATPAPTTPTPTTGPPPPGTTSVPPAMEFTVASFGSGAVAQLPGSGTMLGSGCTPGTDSLSDGIWFGWIAQVQVDRLSFDLGCVSRGSPLSATNTNPQLRELAMDPAVVVQFADGSRHSVEDWQPDPAEPAWIYINHGQITEVAYPATQFSASWVPADVALPVSGGCCATNYVGPASPSDPFPGEGLPADGIYMAEVTKDAVAPDLVVTVRRFVPCSERPELCFPDFASGELGLDRGDPLVLRLSLDAGLTVRIRGIMPMVEPGTDPTIGIQGSGTALLSLLEDLQSAWYQWIEPELDAGTDAGTLMDQLMARGSADPSFPYGPSQGYGASGEPIAYRGPAGVNLTMWFDTPESFPTWATQIEFRDSRPILHIDAGIIAG